MKVTKRDGTVVDYNLTKIKDAIRKAFLACNVNTTEVEEVTLDCALAVDNKLQNEGNECLQVEHIQDVVENVLIEKNFVDIAKAYIKYRESRTKVRNSKMQISKIIDELVNVDSADSDEKRENANINADTMCGSLFKVGGAVMKDYFFNHITPKFAKMHFDGKIHIHDSDLAMFAVNCLMIPTGRLLKTGFSTGHGYLRTPKTIGSASTLIAIIIQSSQNDYFGGQAIPTLDYDLAPFVAKSYVRNVAKFLELKLDDAYSVIENRDAGDIDAYLKEVFIEPIDRYIDSAEHIMDEDGRKTIRYYAEKIIPGGGILSDAFFDKMIEYADRKTERETFQAMEALIHNLCTLASRSGGQVPFSSCNFGTDTSEEGRMVSRNFMKAIDAGLGSGETAIFPIAIFKIFEGITTKGCKNYDLYKQSIAVSARRGFPNWVNVTAPMNYQYYKKGHPETEIATMGCAEGNEIVVWSLIDEIRVTNFKDMWDECIEQVGLDECAENYSLIRPPRNTVKIYDSYNNSFVNVKTLIKNHVSNNFKRVTFSNGRCITVTGDHPLPIENKGRISVDELQIGDKVRTVNLYSLPERMPLSVYFDNPENKRETAWMLGMSLCNVRFKHSEISYYIEYGSSELVDAIVRMIDCLCVDKTKPTTNVILQESDSSDAYYRVVCGIGLTNVKTLVSTFNCIAKSDRSIPSWIFSAPRDIKLAFLAGMIDADGYINSTKFSDVVQISTSNKTLALQQALLAETCGLHARVYRRYCGNTHHADNTTYRVEFNIEEDLPSYLICLKKKANCKNRYKYTYCPTTVSVSNIVDSDLVAPSYDVETDSDRFDLSMIHSHNCRTRVIGNTRDKEHQQVTGRGNLFFTTINLPYLALEVKENNPNASSEEIFNIFLSELDKRVDDCITFSRERFKIACKRKAKNFPFAMGQHLYIGSEDLKPDDSIEKAIHEGSQSVGFCGLAECLVALFGKHHGESEFSQEKGLEIVSRMHDLIESYAKKENVNYSLFATPAEGCAGRLLRACRKRFGVIKGVTDRDYLTNSCHVPVYYKISAYDKIRIEAPYHPLCTAGIIGYLELDYDATSNLEAMETLVDAMAKSGMTYFSINHPIDHDPVCGYVGHIPVGGVCPRCGRREGEGVPAGKLLELQSYRPTPEYAVDKDMLEDVDTTTNDI